MKTTRRILNVLTLLMVLLLIAAIVHPILAYRDLIKHPEYSAAYYTVLIFPVFYGILILVLFLIKKLLVRRM